MESQWPSESAAPAAPGPVRDSVTRAKYALAELGGNSIISIVPSKELIQPQARWIWFGTTSNGEQQNPGRQKNGSLRPTELR